MRAFLLFRHPLNQSQINKLLHDLKSETRLNNSNAMLGFIKTLDGDNQWHVNSQKMILAQDCNAYRQIFMRQTGEKSGCVIVFDKNEATEKINQIYQDIFGRNADSAVIIDRINDLENGIQIGEIRFTIAHNDETKFVINQVYQDILKRDATPDELTAHQDSLAVNTKLTEIRNTIARSDETKTAINQVYQDILKRDSTADELTAHQDSLAVSTKLTEIRNTIARSDETKIAINKIYQDILKHSPKSSDLDSWISKLSENLTLIKVRQLIASGDESKANINRIYHQTLGRNPRIDELDFWITKLSENSTLSDVNELIIKKFFVARTYRVQRGDNLSHMAKRFYGDGNLIIKDSYKDIDLFYKSIFNANRKTISNPDKIFPGQILSIPNVSIPLRYTIRSGDNLTYLAQKFYGDSQQFRKITAVNSDKISNSDKIFPGQVIEIPFD